MAKQEFRVDFRDGRPFEVLTENQIAKLGDNGRPGETDISKIQALDSTNRKHILNDEARGIRKPATGKVTGKASAKSN